MKEFNIALIPGDGIGKEVVPEGTRVLDAAAKAHGGLRFSYRSFPWSCEYYQKHGHMMPADGLDQLRPFDSIFLGAVGFRACRTTSRSGDSSFPFAAVSGSTSISDPFGS